MLNLGIVGLPNVGKSTLFNALTKNRVLAANYPFATVDPNIGVVNLPDSRLAELAKMFHTSKIVPATVSFVDIAGIVRGASQGEGLGNQFLANIREVDAIVHVVRGFENAEIVHVEGALDPLRDINTVRTELALADLQTLDKIIARLGKAVRTDKSKTTELALAESLRTQLNRADGVLGSEGVSLVGPVAAPNTDQKNSQILKSFQLLSTKPTIYVFNVSETELADADFRSRLTAAVAPAEAVFLDAQLEAELIDLSAADAQELLSAEGQTESGLDQLARVGFAVLGLQTFLTAGEKEVRAWQIRQGTRAPQAAGVIHSDFERGFIKAQVIEYAQLMAAGSWPVARALGKIRLEGKDYLMRPDDVVEFMFNV
jgi:GTP-binding protein YchF